MKPHEKDTQDCLAIEEDKAALDCLKKVISKYSGSEICRPKLVLLVQDNCVPCKEETARYASDIANGIIQKVNIKSPEGKTIIQKNGLNYVPDLVLLDCNDDIIPTV